MKIIYVLVVDPCEPNPCQNDGLCLPGKDGSFTCQCVDGYSGDVCEDCDCDEEESKSSYLIF